MDSFELNKILGAILGTLLFVMGVGFLAEAIYEPVHGAGPGYALPEPEGGDEGTGDNGAPPPAVVDIGTLLASADPKAGEASAKKCQACHDFTEGGPNKTGPNLYDVVERLIGSHPGFAYSQGMEDHKAKGDTWTYDNLNHFITAPKSFTPGTKMTFAGIKDDKERANVIAFLSTLSASPKPFPAPAAPTDVATPTSSQVEEGTTSSAESTETPTPLTSSSEAAPAPAPSSSEAAPAPASSSAAPAPAPSSSEAPAPASSEAPAPSSSASEAPASSSAAQ